MFRALRYEALVRYAQAEEIPPALPGFSAFARADGSFFEQLHGIFGERRL